MFTLFLCLYVIWLHSCGSDFCKKMKERKFTQPPFKLTQRQQKENNSKHFSKDISLLRARGDEGWINQITAAWIVNWTLSFLTPRNRNRLYNFRSSLSQSHIVRNIWFYVQYCKYHLISTKTVKLFLYLSVTVVELALTSSHE